MGGRFKREGIYVYLWLIHVEVWQKTTKVCKAIILQLKNKLLKKIFKSSDFLLLSSSWWWLGALDTHVLQFHLLAQVIYQDVSLRISPPLNGNLILAVLVALPRPELLEDAYSICLTHLRNIQLPVCVQQAFYIYVLLQPSQENYIACKFTQ